MAQASAGLVWCRVLGRYLLHCPWWQEEGGSTTTSRGGKASSSPLSSSSIQPAAHPVAAASCASMHVLLRNLCSCAAQNAGDVSAQHGEHSSCNAVSAVVCQQCTGTHE